MDGWQIILIVYAAISLVVFVFYGVDKAKAVAKAWRVPERTLLLLAVVSPIGALLGMLVFRHKIRKPKFYLTVPLLLVIEAALCWWFLFR